MVVDTSAVIAIILEEDDADFFLNKLASSHSRQISVVSYVEAYTVLISRKARPLQRNSNQCCFAQG